MRTYSLTALLPHDPTNATWALMWARRFAWDTPLDADGRTWKTGSLHDEEWAAWLDATAVRYEGVVYYRPHEAAARVIESNPDWLLSMSMDGVSRGFRDPHRVANAIRREGAWVDGYIPAAAIESVKELAPRF